MESKWPFMLITMGLLFALGITVSKVERTVVMNNWDKRRCDLPIMMGSMFFKPDSDPRSNGDFSKDNFSFCLGQYVDSFMEILMKPINVVFNSQVNLASNATGMLNTMRGILKSVSDAFLGILQVFLNRFNTSIFQISRIIQYLRMAMQRMNAIMMSFIYIGLTVFTGMLNAIKFIFKVILIICAIMLGLIIILFFILFPFIPMVLAVIGIIVYNYVIIDRAMNSSSGDAISRAERYKSGFCFSKDTLIACKEGSKKISDIKIGDELYNCGKVTAIIEMHGKGVALFNLNGIYVSGSHLVKEDKWKSVSEDSRAIPTDVESDILYCFNTTSHNIPVVSKNETILFRDWEELEEDDKCGQYMWNYKILTKLNHSSHYNKWKDGLKTSDIPLMNTKVKTINGFVNITELRLLDKVLDRHGNEQSILGIVQSDKIGTQGTWHTELYEFDGVWKKGKSTVIPGNDIIKGRMLITETGEFIIENDKIVRDFTDIGYTSIYETYPFVISRLNRE